MERIKHLSKAEHNEKFFRNFDINSTDFKDWIVVGVFYSVLHYYEAYFALKNKHSGAHDTMDDWIDADNSISGTWYDYRELKQYRYKASYGAKRFTPEEIRNLILPKFDNIKSRLLSLR